MVQLAKVSYSPDGSMVHGIPNAKPEVTAGATGVPHNRRATARDEHRGVRGLFYSTDPLSSRVGFQTNMLPPYWARLFTCIYSSGS